MGMSIIAGIKRIRQGMFSFLMSAPKRMPAFLVLFGLKSQRQPRFLRGQANAFPTVANRSILGGGFGCLAVIIFMRPPAAKAAPGLAIPLQKH